MMEEIRDYLKEKKCGSADNLNRVKGYIREYLLQYTTEEQLIKLGINTNTNLVDKLGEVYIARYYPTKTEMPSITENTAVRMFIRVQMGKITVIQHLYLHLKVLIHYMIYLKIMMLIRIRFL